MTNITVGRYGDKEAKDEAGNGYVGWVEPEDKSWVVFIDTDNNPTVFTKRDLETGAIL